MVVATVQCLQLDKEKNGDDKKEKVMKYKYTIFYNADRL